MGGIQNLIIIKISILVGPYRTVPKRPIPLLPGHFLMVKMSLEMSLDGGRGKLIPWDSTLGTKLGEVVNFCFLVQISNFFLLSFSLMVKMKLEINVWRFALMRTTYKTKLYRDRLHLRCFPRVNLSI